MQNPEPWPTFIDVAVTGDGEPSLPVICDKWMDIKESMQARDGLPTGEAGLRQREAALLELAATLPFCYVPRFYEPEYRMGASLR